MLHYISYNLISVALSIMLRCKAGSQTSAQVITRAESGDIRPTVLPALVKLLTLIAILRSGFFNAFKLDVLL